MEKIVIDPEQMYIQSSCKERMKVQAYFLKRISFFAASGVFRSGFTESVDKSHVLIKNYKK